MCVVTCIIGKESVTSLESRVYQTWLGLDGPIQYKVWRLSAQNYTRWLGQPNWAPNCGADAIVTSQGSVEERFHGSVIKG